MAHKITDECISCGSCAGTCPVGVITEGDDKYVVDADSCIDCGACEDACPVGAIIAEYFHFPEGGGRSFRLFIFPNLS